LRASIREIVGSSSKTIRTTGVSDDTAAPAADASRRSTSSDTGEANRKMARNTAGAGVSTVRNRRAVAACR
jgi:hypothetical protein